MYLLNIDKPDRKYCLRQNPRPGLSMALQTQDVGLFYVRFMDDWVVIAPSRWKLRKVVKQVNEILAELLLEKHPDKTFIGKAVRGFSFLGYYLTPWAVSVAQVTIENMKQRIARLYEQGAGMTDIGRYVVRWLRCSSQS